MFTPISCYPLLSVNCTAGVTGTHWQLIIVIDWFLRQLKLFCDHFIQMEVPPVNSPGCILCVRLIPGVMGNSTGSSCSLIN